MFNFNNLENEPNGIMGNREVVLKDRTYILRLKLKNINEKRSPTAIKIMGLREPKLVISLEKINDLGTTPKSLMIKAQFKDDVTVKVMKVIYKSDTGTIPNEVEIKMMSWEEFKTNILIDEPDSSLLFSVIADYEHEKTNVSTLDQLFSRSK